MLKAFFIILILTFTMFTSGAAQEYRLALNPPSFEIYKSMLEFAETEKYDKISNSWGFLGEIPGEIRNKFGVDLETDMTAAVREKNKAGAVTAVRKLIYYDMKDIFSVILTNAEESPSYLKGLVKVAYLDYLQLSPEVEKTKLEVDTNIKNLFREAVLIFSQLESGGGPPDSTGAADPETRVRTALSQIESDFLKVFPDFSTMYTMPPIITNRAKPAYPTLAREAGIEGTVLVKVVVSPEGKVVGAMILESDVTSTMEEEALRAARLCEFEPARNGNLKVTSTVVIPFDFRL